jgi:hypothetical protein
MKARLNLKPGQKGTKALVEMYGKIKGTELEKHILLDAQ